MERGYLIEFADPDALLAGLRRLRALGYRRLDAFTPYPMEGLLEAVGKPRSRIPVYALVAALVGGGLAYLLQLWLTAVNYPLNVGGRPLHSAPAFIPITFEMAVLCASLTTFVAVLLCGGLPRLWHPVLEVEGFERATVDRFWIGIEADDPALAPQRLEPELTPLGALRVVELGRPR